jgi:plasmid stability protein
MNLMPFIMSSYATSLSFSGAGNAMAANEARMGLANGVTGNESQPEVASLAAQDKALSLESAYSGIQYQVAQAMQQSAQAMKKKDQEQRQRMLDNGVLFF